MSSQLEFFEAFEEEESFAIFVEVLLPLALSGSFTYRVSKEFVQQITPGKRVVVQFGKKKIMTALVLEIHTRVPEKYIAKYILDVIDEVPIVTQEQFDFWKWMASYYCCTMGEVMSAALPANMKLESETKIALVQDVESLYDLSDSENMVLDILERKKIVSIIEVGEALQIKNILPLIRSLYDKGLITLEEELNHSYKPKTDIFVRHVFDENNKEFVEGVFKDLERSPKQADVLLAYFKLKNEKSYVKRKLLLQEAKAAITSLEALVKKGLMECLEMEISRIEEVTSAQTDFVPDEQQILAIDSLKQQFQEKDIALLYGVTGSGKTNVYIRMIDEIITKGKQALYLVPEITLTAQLVGRLRKQYGGRIGIYHSRFNANERVEIWTKTLKGEYDVVLGARSAIFLPFKSLGIIVVDEEHENSYKQSDPTPRYHARDSAVFLASVHRCKIILGSATPSLESYNNVERNRYAYVEMLTRFGEIQMPELILSDLKVEKKRKTMKSHFSLRLFEEMNDTLKNHGQIILFQNRRGYAPILECQDCAWSPKCRYCDITLTYHQNTKKVVCHYCGYQEEVPKKCGACNGYDLKMLGFGTEKIEDELQIFFPEVKSLRLDQDTIRNKNSYTKIITAFEDNEAHILVGTQMVTKGLDFDNARLVGILNADQLFKYPNFRAEERCFQLISQVSGRAGRRKIRGKVIIQTHEPEHPVFGYLLNNDFKGFYEWQLAQRLEFKYPPFYRLIHIVLKDLDQNVVKRAGDWLGNRLKDIFLHRVLGPEIPIVNRLRNKYLNGIMLKFERQNLSLEKSKAQLMEQIALMKKEKDFHKTQVIVNVDPG